MKYSKFLLLVFGISILFVCESNAQTVLDGVYVKENTPNRRVIPYVYLREADMKWTRRIWRVVDLREKINHTLYYPIEPIATRKSLTQVIFDAILKDGTITAYEDEEFKKALTRAEVTAMLSRVDTVDVEDADGNYQKKLVPKNIEPKQAIQYKIKEDWFFDRQRSVMECRIIGMGLLIEGESESGEIKKNTLFWIYYPEARYVFANTDVFNRQNDAERRTYEDIFWKRMFGSYIYKEENVYDRLIADYRLGLDGLLEAERIKEDIFNQEHDVWEF